MKEDNPILTHPISGLSCPLYPELTDTERDEHKKTIKRYTNHDNIPLIDAERIVALRIAIQQMEREDYRQQQCNNAYSIDKTCRMRVWAIHRRKEALERLEEKYHVGYYTRPI